MDTTFCGLSFRAPPGRVMTPRPASEQLVAAARGIIGDRPARVVDAGTGSGALAIAIASAARNALVWGTDTSPDAVAVALENVRRHGLAGRIDVLAERLGTNRGALYKTLHDARRKLRAYLEEQGLHLETLEEGS